MKACLRRWTSIEDNIIIDIIIVLKVVDKIQFTFLLGLTPVNQGLATNTYQVTNFVSKYLA